MNGNRSLSFLLPKSAVNEYAYFLVEEESVVEYNGSEYRIKQIEERTVNGTPIKSVSAVHVFFDIIDKYQYETVSGNLNIVQALNHALGITDWTWVNRGAFSTVEFEDFGDDTALAMFQTILERYGAEFEITGRRQVTLKNEIGVQTNAQFRYGYNVKTISKSVNTKNLSTYIKGYGKRVSDSDKLSGNLKNYESRTGTWEDTDDPYHFTRDVGATMQFSFTGTGFRFYYWSDRNGGVWEFVLDGEDSQKLSVYSDDSKSAYKDLWRGLDDKEHHVIATFRGDDEIHAPIDGKGKSKGWVRYSSSNDQKTIQTYRSLSGDELYTLVADYTSPNASKYKDINGNIQLKHAPPFQSDNVNNVDEIVDQLKKLLIDEPEISIKIDIIELSKQGIVEDSYNLGDYIYLIYEPLDIDIQVRVMEKTEYPESSKSPEIVLSNITNNMSDYPVAFNQVQKNLNQLTDDEGNLTLKLKRLYRNTNHYSDSTGDWYIAPDDPNAYVHIGAGGLDVHRGLIRVERTDGFATILGGELNFGFNLGKPDPPWTSAAVEVYNTYWRTMSTEWQTCQAYYFEHNARYLKFDIGAFTDVDNVCYVKIVDSLSNPTTLAYKSFTNQEGAPEGDTNFTVDLGVPTGELKAVFLQIMSFSPDKYSYLRTTRQFLRG